MKLSEGMLSIINNKDAIKIVATVNKEGEPHAVVNGSLSALDEETLAIPSIMDCQSQNHRNLMWSLWFNKKISIQVYHPGTGASFQIKGTPYRYIMQYQDPIFRRFCELIRTDYHTSLGGVFLIRPESCREQTLSARLKEERKKKHDFPYFLFAEDW